jgi:hypothetical protein
MENTDLRVWSISRFSGLDIIMFPADISIAIVPNASSECVEPPQIIIQQQHIVNSVIVPWKILNVHIYS